MISGQRVSHGKHGLVFRETQFQSPRPLLAVRPGSPLHILRLRFLVGQVAMVIPLPG